MQCRLRLVGPPPSLVSVEGLVPPLLLYKLTPCMFVSRHTASATSLTGCLPLRGIPFVDYWMEMSDTVKPLTSFLIEDILSLKDSSRLAGKCCSQKMDRCCPWTEESEMLSEQLCPQVTAFRVPKGELLQANSLK